MATRFSPAWRRPSQRWRSLVAVVLTAASVSFALSACAATDARTEAASRHGVAAGSGHQGKTSAQRAAAETPADVPAGSEPAAAQAAAAAAVTLTTGIPYAGTQNPLQRLDVCAPAAASDHPRPAVLLIHGGGWMKGDKSTVRADCEWLADSGFVVFDTDYRLAPTARFPAQPEDVRAALRFMRTPATVQRFDIDPARVGTVGGSAGGNLAAQLALAGRGGALTSGDRVAALVDLSGPIDLTAAGQSPAQSPALTTDELTYLRCRTLACPAAARASPLREVDASDPPTFIGQASTDFVPHEQGDRLKAALQRAGVPVTLVQIPARAHSFGVLTPAMRAAIVAFLHQHLGS